MIVAIVVVASYLAQTHYSKKAELLGVFEKIVAAISVIAAD